MRSDSNVNHMDEIIDKLEKGGSLTKDDMDFIFRYFRYFNIIDEENKVNDTTSKNAYKINSSKFTTNDATSKNAYKINSSKFTTNDNTLKTFINNHPAITLGLICVGITFASIKLCEHTISIGVNKGIVKTLNNLYRVI